MFVFLLTLSRGFCMLPVNFVLHSFKQVKFSQVWQSFWILLTAYGIPAFPAALLCCLHLLCFWLLCFVLCFVLFLCLLLSLSGHMSLCLRGRLNAGNALRLFSLCVTPVVIHCVVFGLLCCVSASCSLHANQTPHCCSSPCIKGPISYPFFKSLFFILDSNGAASHD